MEWKSAEECVVKGEKCPYIQIFHTMSQGPD